MAFMKDILTHNIPIWEECAATPFVQEVQTGKLPLEKFKRYMIQDSIYLKNYARIYGKAILFYCTMLKLVRRLNMSIKLYNTKKGLTMMNFIEIAKKRYSVRNYSSKKVEKEKLDKILQAAHVAPTAANLQPVHLIAVESKEGLEKISKGANIYNAPLAIIVCADHNKAWVRPFDQKQTGDIDAAILTDHMMLEATELGLGTVWVCYFQPDVIRKEFDLPDNLEPINILVIGYGNIA